MCPFGPVLFNLFTLLFETRFLQPNSNFYSNDVGMIALALLANDRYRAISDPVQYMNEEKRPYQRLFVAFVSVILVIGLDATANAFFIYNVLTEKNSLFFKLISYGFRATYQWICLF